MKLKILAIVFWLCLPLVLRAQTFTPDQLKDRTIERRAIEAVIWGMPAVNFDRMLQAALKNKANVNQVVYWSRLPSWKNQTLTPNPDAVYLMPFIDTTNGPMVLEIPPADDGSITGSIDDCWQTAVEDVGPAGLDKGEGGKYVILPPDRKFKLPEGYIPLSSDTFQSYALLRSILKSGSDDDVAKAVAYGKRVKLYPLSQASNPPATVFVDVVDELFDATIPYDASFFESLNRVVQREPWITRDKVMIDQLKSFGIEKGKPYQPDARMQSALNQAAKDAHAWLEVKYPEAYNTPFNEGAHWALPISKEFEEGIQSDYMQPDVYAVDSRGLAYSFAFFSAKHFGAGQYYMFAIVDKDGQPLNGANRYRLRVPAKAPVRQYWSATIYDRETHAFIRDVSRASRSSQSVGLQTNADGSADIYFAPTAPPGKESNWVPTNANGGFEALFRFYGPEKPLFDKSWKLPDIELVR